MTKRNRSRVLAGRRWLYPGKRPETAIGYLCSRGHYVFQAEGPEGDACQSKNIGTIFVRPTQRQCWWGERDAEIIDQADESLARKLKTWRQKGAPLAEQRVDETLGYEPQPWQRRRAAEWMELSEELGDLT